LPPAGLPVEAVADGVRVSVRLTPKASRAGFAGIELDAAGRSFLKVRVHAPAQGGKANAALVKLLAGIWGLPRSRLNIIAGLKDRRKTVHVSGDPKTLVEHLKEWIETQNV
jgi:hypothetical protein